MVKTERLKIPLMQDITAITCECGQKFILLYLYEEGDKIEAFQQDEVNFCPNCGKKGGKE